MAGNRDDLYRWKRITSKNKPQSSVTKKAQRPGDDIQDWIKKVEEASNQAAAATFGLPVKGHKSNGHYGVEATLEAVHDHDEAYSEAQDLLSQWMAEKCNLDDHLTMDDNYDDYGYEGGGDRLRSPGVKSELKNQWDDMIERNDPTLLPSHKYTSSEALCADIESRDDYSTVQSILGSMMEKEVFEPAQRKKLRAIDDEKKRSDPRTTMAARQQRVKENREKREQERHQQLAERQGRKSVQLQARQMVQQEEKQKTIKAQREEMKIKEEMAHIRKEMQQQKRLAEEARNREKAIEAEARRQEEWRLRKEEEVMRRIEDARHLQEEQERKVMDAARMREAQEAHKLMVLQKHFHAWYQLVRHQHLQIGKARALSDWRSLLRAWNAWRAYIRACRAEREAKQTEMEIKLTHRRKLAADNHYRGRLLRKCFAAWRVFCQRENLGKEISRQQSKTRSKMAAFLEAAASGKLWTKRSEGDVEMAGEAGSARDAHSGRPESASRDVDELFGKVGPDPISNSSDPSARRNATHSRSETRATNQSSQKPKYAWQVTRKHVNLTAEEIASIGDNMDAASGAVPNAGHPPGGRSEAQLGKRPIQYTVNNFEHRYAAQQRILSEQQEQLREQRRLIEELQTAHKQQGHRRQLQQIQDGEGIQQGELPQVGNQVDNINSKDGFSARSDSTADVSTTRTNMSGKSGASYYSQDKARPKVPILEGMEDRAAQRAKLKAEREERKRRKEEQKLAEMQVEEQRKTAAEEAEKKAAVEKRREEKRLAKQREADKQRRIELAQRQMAAADAHYRHLLLRNYGFLPWCKLLRMAKQNVQVAEDHHSHALLHRCLLPWHHVTQEVIQEKNDLADVRYSEILLRRSFNSWKRFGHYQSIQLQRARRHYASALKSRVLRAWQDYLTNERLRTWQAEEMADEHNEKRIVKTAFLGWRRYPKMLKQERQREIRLQEMRRKVASIIPDFGLT